MSENKTVYEIIKHFQEIEYAGCIGVKTVADAVKLFIAMKASGAPHRP